MKGTYLSLITIGFFLLSFINIHLALLGIFCILGALLSLLIAGDKVWCKVWCPRIQLYKVVKGKSGGLKAPRFFTTGDMKWILLGYFLSALLLITFSTILVAMGRIQPMLYPRFLVVVPIPLELPQLLPLENLPTWISHLSYRIFSMMSTTTLLGLLVTLIWKPRTWCLICPIGTLSDEYRSQKKKEK